MRDIKELENNYADAIHLLIGIHNFGDLSPTHKALTIKYIKDWCNNYGLMFYQDEKTGFVGFQLFDSSEIAPGRKN